eukprot:3039148-Prymnesium_polylepis.1
MYKPVELQARIAAVHRALAQPGQASSSSYPSFSHGATRKSVGLPKIISPIKARQEMMRAMQEPQRTRLEAEMAHHYGEEVSRLTMRKIMQSKSQEAAKQRARAAQQAHAAAERAWQASPDI